MTQTIKSVSKHNVLAEYYDVCENQAHNQSEYFIQTMTDEDMRKITVQLIDKSVCNMTTSVGDTYRRTLEAIEKTRTSGKLSHLRT